MAALTSTAKAKALGLTMRKISGVEPSYEYYPDYVRIYYEPDRLKIVQQKLDSWTSSSNDPSDVRVDWMPMVTPLVIKKTWPVLLGIFAAGYLLGSR